MVQANEGVPLDHYLRANGPIPYSKAGRIIIAVLQELRQREAAGAADVVTVIHPGRLLVTGGKVVLLDEPELAVDLDANSDPGVEDTLAPYVSPEELTGHAPDERATLYSIGCSFYEMLTGERPFPFEDPDEIRNAHVEAPAPDPCSIHPSVPVSIAEVVQKLLEKSPRRRPQDFTVAITAVRHSLGMIPQPAAPSRSARRSPAPERSSRRERLGSRRAGAGRGAAARQRIEQREPEYDDVDDDDANRYRYRKPAPICTYVGLGLGILVSLTLLVHAVTKERTEAENKAQTQRDDAAGTKQRIVARRRTDSALDTYLAEEKKAAANFRRLLSLPYRPALKRDALEQSLTRFYHLPSGRRMAEEHLRLYRTTRETRTDLRRRQRQE